MNKLYSVYANWGKACKPVKRTNDNCKNLKNIYGFHYWLELLIIYYMIDYLLVCLIPGYCIIKGRWSLLRIGWITQSFTYNVPDLFNLRKAEKFWSSRKQIDDLYKILKRNSILTPIQGGALSCWKGGFGTVTVLG